MRSICRSGELASNDERMPRIEDKEYTQQENERCLRSLNRSYHSDACIAATDLTGSLGG